MGENALAVWAGHGFVTTASPGSGYSCDGLPHLQARIAGVLYVIIMALAVLGPFQVAPSGLVRGDVAATADRILASKWSYSLGGATELIVYACDVWVALIFYELLTPVSRSYSRLALLFRLVFAAVAGANVLNHFAPLLVFSGTQHTAAFTPDQTRALAITFLRLHTTGFDIALVFFGIHCIVAGALFFRAAFLPRILGALLVCSGLAYLTNSLTALVLPAQAAGVFRNTLVLGAGEILLPLWLLFRGVNLQRWEEQAARRQASGSLIRG